MYSLVVRGAAAAAYLPAKHLTLLLSAAKLRSVAAYVVKALQLRWLHTACIGA
jgi:hypothetical protein